MAVGVRVLGRGPRSRTAATMGHGILPKRYSSSPTVHLPSNERSVMRCGVRPLTETLTPASCWRASPATNQILRLPTCSGALRSIIKKQATLSRNWTHNIIQTAHGALGHRSLDAFARLCGEGPDHTRLQKNLQKTPSSYATDLILRSIRLILSSRGRFRSR
ncbi:MAG: hypothetical protein QOG42_2605 [Solirubrobacteraceae bacterium]|nr:hypothetical protein [Solirubrobacteraceae bacterium]